MKILKKISTTFTMIVASSLANHASAAWAICLEGPYFGMAMNARIVRNMSATERATFAYHQYSVVGHRLEPAYAQTSYGEEEYQPGLSSLDLMYTIFWVTNAPIRVAMYGHLMNMVYADPNIFYTHVADQCNNLTHETWIIPDWSV